MDELKKPKIVVLIPCLNEEKSIGEVIRGFKAELPQAEIIIFDNASTDRTAEIAKSEGAQVLFETRRGKGYVVQSMYEHVDADIYVMVDGDNTYPIDKVHALIAPLLNGEADMTIGSRILSDDRSGFKPVNWFGNIIFQHVINTIFRTQLTDILSGYRTMNRKLVKSLPLFMTGFEIEAEITVKALERGFRLNEIPVVLRPREAGSYSKIRVVRDGLRILGTILALFRDYKPLTFFGAWGLLFIMIGLIPGINAVIGYLETGLVLRFPSAILAVGLILTGLVFIAIGLILHTIDRRFREMEHFMRLLSNRNI
jgi:glycosyltransferase involved in cell wall biosynthesis